MEQRNSMAAKAGERLASLDVLRGLDLFFLVGLESVMHRLHRAIDCEGMDRVMWHFSHVDWEGFSPWDLVMPLFLFMSGVSVPFALQRFRQSGNHRALAWRLAKRVALLWIFGMMCQGNLLGMDPQHIYLFSNTLQAIAVGYLGTALLVLHTGWRTQTGVFVGLLLAYWGVMQWGSAPGYGLGQYTPDANMAEWVDRVVLGRFRDAASVAPDGTVEFAPWYRYTWILSSLGFVATVLSGALAGHLLRSTILAPQRRAALMALAGVAMVATGWLWGMDLPVIKKIWTSSMVLVSSGYCLLLMALTYYVIDVRGHRRGLDWLRVYGTNSIAAYMMAHCLNLGGLVHPLLHGLEQYVGQAWYQVVLAVAASAIVYVVLWRMNKLHIYLKV